MLSNWEGGRAVVSFTGTGISWIGAVDEWGGLATCDVVFCRNVFIYFSDDAIRRVAIGLERRMPEHGHLFLGASESLTRFGLGFRLQEFGRGFVYVKALHGGAT